MNKMDSIPRKFLLNSMIVIGCICCGGGGGGDAWLFPLWVESDVVVSDIDSDGRNDVLTLAMLSTSMSHNEGRLRLYRQMGRGGFSESSTYIVGEYPWKLVVNDIDGDTLPDLLVTDPDRRNVWLLLQNPEANGQFLPQELIASGMRADDAAVADFNNDSTSDIAIVDNQFGSNRMVILYQDSIRQGMFLPAVDLFLPGSSSTLVAGDIDGDGLADLLSWIYMEPRGWTPNGVLAFSLQQPDGTLGPITTLAPQTGLNVRHLSIADYNGDGANDLFVFFTPSSEDYVAKLTVILQESVPGTFAAPIDTLLSGIRGTDDAVVADLNGDGRPDVAVVGFFPEGSPSTVGSRLNLFIQSNGASFSLAGVYEMTIPVSRVTAGDIDGDGLNDLIVLGGENQCMVLRQSNTDIGTFQPPQSLIR